MSATRKIIVSFIVLVILGGAGVGIYFLISSDSLSSGGDNGQKDLDAIDLDECLTAHNPDKYSWSTYNTCGARRYVALTFDDGPNIQTTPDVLRDLESTQVVATFFVSPAVNGEATNEQCGLIREILKAGHQVASHSWNHRNFQDLTQEEMARQLCQTKQWIYECAGDQVDKLSVTQFRPPYGTLTGDNAEYVTDFGYTLAGWNIDSGDAGTDTEDRLTTPQASLAKITSEFESNIREGNSAIILMHDGDYKDDGVKGLIPLLVNYFNQMNYVFVTGDQCHSDCQGFGVQICEDSHTWPRFYEL